jgi:hypothetical protein
MHVFTVTAGCALAEAINLRLSNEAAQECVVDKVALGQVFS